MAKAKNKRPPRRTKASKRLARYQYRLETLRKYVAGFDAKSYESLYGKKPRSESGKIAKRRALSRFNARFRQLRPYVAKAHKYVKPKGKDAAFKLATLREFSGMPKIKGLRAVPIEVASKSVRVSVSKKGRVSIRDGRLTTTLYRLPRRPHSHYQKLPDGSRRYLTAGEDAREMVRKMLSSLPESGRYMIQTRQFLIIGHDTDKEGLLEEMDRLIYQYERKGVTWILPEVIGLKHFKTDLEGLWDYKRELANARTKAAKDRVERKRAQHERAAFKLGKKAKQTKRGKATGRR